MRLTVKNMLRGNDITIGYRISYLANSLMTAIYKRVRLEEGMNRSEGASLYCLGNMEPLTAMEISEMTVRPRNSVSAAITRLTRDGYIIKAASHADNRVSPLYLSEKGKACSGRIRTIFIEQEQELLGQFSDLEKKEQLSNLLASLIFDAVESESPRCL